MKKGMEFVKVTGDIFAKAPYFFQNETDGYAELFRHDQLGMLHVEDDHPHYYFRNLNMDSTRWAGAIRPGDGPLATQTVMVDREIAQSIPATPYGPIEGEPFAYRMRTEDPNNLYEWHEDYCHFVEDGILDVKCKYFPYALVMHYDSPYKATFINLAIYGEGTYNGQKIKYMGCIDRVYAPKGRENEIIANATTYLNGYYSCIREDGRKEYFFGQINGDKNGEGAVGYYLEGEEPILSTEIYLDADWYKLPYVDDGTCVYTDGTWRFEGKEIHVKGLWGSKGFTPVPRVERHGQSQCFGTWHEGDVPYVQQNYCVFNESMEVYEERIRKMGFEIRK